MRFRATLITVAATNRSALSRDETRSDCDGATELMYVPSGINKSVYQTRTNLLYSIFTSLITNRLSVAHDSIDLNRQTSPRGCAAAYKGQTEA